MEQLFRFVMIRPPEAVEEEGVVRLERDTLLQTALADAARAEDPHEARRQAARAFVDAGEDYVDAGGDLHLGSGMLALRRRIENEDLAGAEVLAKAVEEVFDTSPRDLVDSPEYGEDSRHLADSILAMRLLASEHAKPLAALAKALRAMELVRRLAAGDAVLDQPAAVRRALEAPLLLPPALSRDRLAAPPPRAKKPRPPKEQAATPLSEARRRAKRLDHTLDELLRVRPSDLTFLEGEKAPPAKAEPGATVPTEATRAPESTGKAPPPRAGGSRKLALSTAAAEGLSEETRDLLRRQGLNASTTPIRDLLARLDTALTTTTREVQELRPSSVSRHIGHVGGLPIYTAEAVEAVPVEGGEEPVEAAMTGACQNAGVGELLLVKQQLVRYQGGDVAHIENVLEGENKLREHRRASKTEEFLYTEEERQVEEERELESTDRYEIRREAQEAIAEKSKLEAGMSLSAGYGPFVQFEANVGYATENSKERSKKFASDFSREVVNRALNKQVEKVREKRALRFVEEFEETNRHELLNPAGGGHVTGVYQWVDKVYEAQIFNYGLREMYDFLVPDPALFLIEGLRRDLAEETGLEKPVPFALTPAEIYRTNYHDFVQRYEVTDVEPPPEPLVVVSKTFHAGPDAPEADPKGTWVFSERQDLPPGYEAFEAHAVITFYAWDLDKLAIDVQIGDRTNRFLRDGWIVGGSWSWDLALENEVESLPLALTTWQACTFSLGIEIVCRPTARKMDEWRHATHAAILQAYRQRKSEYEEKLAALMIREGIEITGRSPAANRELERGELKKGCVSLLTRQHFDDFDAMTTGSNGLPQIQLERADEVGPTIRFLEQAFEWENMTYVFYPYFWGSKKRWIERLRYQDADPEFVTFITAGAARVVVPARPGFENALDHFAQNEEPWQGGELPDIGDDLYLPIIEELKESLGAPGEEVATGEPWSVVVPTNLVRLRPDGSLPTWVKDEAGNWLPADATDG